MNRLIVALGFFVLTGLPFNHPAAAQSAQQKFGTREPATCPDRKGPFNSVNAQKYVTCDIEGPYLDHMLIATNIVVQMGAPRAYIHGQDSGLESIDVRQRIYEVRGSYVQYWCDPIYKVDIEGGPGNVGENCTRYTYPAAKGRCWKDTFGDWHCIFADLTSTQKEDHQPPPTGH